MAGSKYGSPSAHKGYKYLFNGLRPGEKRAKASGEEPAAHGGEECAARMVKTKADALVIGSQAPICRA